MLSYITEWMRVNKLSLNPKKTEFKIIGHPLKTRCLDLPGTLQLNASDIKGLIKRNLLGL